MRFLAAILLLPLAPIAQAAVSAPATLSATGLWADPAVRRVDPANRPYAPQYPLWTDGAAKRRWVRLPDDRPIDATDPGFWEYPPGTSFWKEFAFDGRPVETRWLHRRDDGSWIAVTYVWREDGSDADLAPVEGVPAHAEIAPGVRHAIPSVADCFACHGTERMAVLGFGALQLSDDRDPAAPHAEPAPEGGVTLRALLDEGRLDPPREEWRDRPPRIEARTPRERAALGYLESNCGSCHGPHGTAAFLGLDLTAPSALRTTVGVRSLFPVPGYPAREARRIRPDLPEASALLYRMAHRGDAAQMPPMGSAIVDEPGLALVRGWIAEELALTTPSR